MIKAITNRPIINRLLLACLPIVLSGCASFGKGVAEAVLEKSDAEDTRVCQVREIPSQASRPDWQNRTVKPKY